MTKWVFTLALGLWLTAVGRGHFDTWIDTTVLPSRDLAVSTEVVDRDGVLLRAYTIADGRWRLPVRLEDVDPAYVRMLIAYEDKRFMDHSGVDILAFTRAGWQAVRHREIVSGGSTLTMQVARLLEDGSTGQWSGKLRQIRVAMALEGQLSKDEILTLYLNHAPYGGNIEGVRAASYAYFDRPPGRLTPAQAALLVALPQSPEARRPDRAPDTATQARDMVLARLNITAPFELVDQTRHSLPQVGPHLTDRAHRLNPDVQRLTLTIDHDLQLSLEALAKQSVAGRSDHVQAAIVVANHQTGEILASIGSSVYSADERGGFIDLTQAVRSPGSTLKPLVYGLGFDRGLIHPETLIADRPTNFGGYAPRNFDGRFRGELRVKSALQQSLNIPVVAITQALGPYHLMAGLRQAGTDPKLSSGAPGLAIALGGIGMTLEDLVQLYAGIANQGQAVSLSWEPVADTLPKTQIMNRVAAWYVADILQNTPRPRGVQGDGIAFKTGTSYGHRDAWAIGFDGEHVVGVWMGRSDGTPVPGAFGGDLAAPAMFAAFARIKPDVTPIGPPPYEALIVSTAGLPRHLQYFGQENATQHATPQISFPPNGAIVEGSRLTLKVRDGKAPFVWLANGLPVARTFQTEVNIAAPSIGFSSLTVIDSNGKSDRAEIQLR